MSQQKTERGFLAHIHPPLVTTYSLRFRSTYGLGTVLVALFIILAASGMLLTFAYDPRFVNAWDSVWEISCVYPYGEIVRTIHYTAGNLFAIVCVLHLLKVVFNGAYLGERYRNYLYGLLLLACVFAALATGYFLPMSEVSYWALVVGASFLEYLPFVGSLAKRLVLGGQEVGDPTMFRLYVLHIAVLPLMLLGATSLHLWRIRKDGGLLKPEGIDPSALEKVSFKFAVHREQTVFLLVAVFLVLWSLLFPLSMTPRAIPMAPPNPVKAAWFFIALQETLSYSVVWGGIIPLAGVTLFFLLAPPLVGDAAGSPVLWRRRAFFSATIVILGAYTVFTLVGLCLRGPNWKLINPLNAMKNSIISFVSAFPKNRLEFVPYPVYRMNQINLRIDNFNLPAQLLDVAVDGAVADDPLIGIYPVHQLRTSEEASRMRNKE